MFCRIERLCPSGQGFIRQAGIREKQKQFLNVCDKEYLAYPGFPGETITPENKKTSIKHLLISTGTTGGNTPASLLFQILQI
jgi:hypothetical protein